MYDSNYNTLGLEKARGWPKVAVLVIAWLIIISLAKDVWQIRMGFGRVTESTTRLEMEQARNASLKQKLDLVITEDYRERLIRDKLNMQKEGEVLVVMPKKDGLGMREEVPNQAPEPNWQKWLKLLRG